MNVVCDRDGRQQDPLQITKTIDHGGQGHGTLTLIRDINQIPVLDIVDPEGQLVRNLQWQGHGRVGVVPLNHPIVFVRPQMLTMVHILGPQTRRGFARDEIFREKTLKVTVRSPVFGAKMMFGGDSKGQQHVDGSNLLIVDPRRSIGLLLDPDPDHAGHVPDTGVHGRPNLATFPETIIGRVGSEGENQTNDDTQRRDLAGGEGGRRKKNIKMNDPWTGSALLPSGFHYPY